MPLHLHSCATSALSLFFIARAGRGGGGGNIAGWISSAQHLKPGNTQLRREDDPSLRRRWPIQRPSGLLNTSVRRAVLSDRVDQSSLMMSS
jgi:hypothetical protein